MSQKKALVTLSQRKSAATRAVSYPNQEATKVGAVVLKNGERKSAAR